ncbi:hypothetical protein [Rufibacter tibetensis]|uniref:Uncharacterized protein n=1 Tax=Rufibacter tibetensis TaxID=512763 RepID=A0A0P0D3X9_9BACT|nr:hypothetical protein [Rufibacter tibetensis]ALJ01635.1 hypothetical protein DC20_21430 [Rufibacter tibetensis]
MECGQAKENTRFIPMLPDPAEKQKPKVRGYLVEALEHAMGACSKEIYQWLAKYTAFSQRLLVS